MELQCAGKIIVFFFGRHDFWNRYVTLDSYSVSYFIVEKYMLPGPVALGKAENVRDLQRGITRHWSACGAASAT